MDTTLIHNNSKLWRYTCIWHASTDQGTHIIGSIMHHLDQGTCTTCSWLGTQQTPFGYINTVTVNFQYKPQINKLMHHYIIELMSGRFFHHGCYWILAVCSQILHMECLSCSNTVLDKGIRPSDTQHCQRESVHSFLLQWLCLTPVTCWRRSIIWSLPDHIEWCLERVLASEDIGYESGG